MTNYDTKTIHKILLAVPVELLKRIDQVADVSGISRTKTILTLLERALNEPIRSGA